MSINEFQHQVFEIALSSVICDIPIVRRVSPTSINIRIDLTVAGYIDIFYNQESDRIAYALIRDGQRIYGADNTGGWHFHPFDNPAQHVPLSAAMSFADFIEEIEKFYNLLFPR